MKILIDKNKKLIQAVKKMLEENNLTDNLVAITGDIFKIAEKENIKIATASNPDFDMAGGLDLEIKKKFPDEIKDPFLTKQTEHLCFIVSVDENRKATKDTVASALTNTIYRQYNIAFTGFGTGIGGMKIEEFVEILKNVLIKDFRKYKLKIGNYNEFRSNNKFGDNNWFGNLNEFGSYNEFGDKNKFRSQNKFEDKNEFGNLNLFLNQNKFGSNNKFGKLNEFEDNNLFGSYNEFGDNNKFWNLNEFEYNNKFGDLNEFRDNNKFEYGNEFEYGNKFRSYNEFKYNNEFGDKNEFRNNNEFEDYNKFRSKNKFEYNNKFGNLNEFGDNNKFEYGNEFRSKNKFGDNNEFGDLNEFEDNNKFEYGNEFRNNNEFRDNNKFKSNNEFWHLNEFGDNNKFEYGNEFRSKNKFGDNNEFGSYNEFKSNNKFGKCYIKHTSMIGSGDILRKTGRICEKENPTFEDFAKTRLAETIIIKKGKKNVECFIFYKAVREDRTTQGNIVYEDKKWIKDDIPFALKGSCIKGGLYFSDFDFVATFNSKYTTILKVAVPKNKKNVVIDPEGNKCRTDELYVIGEVK